MPLNKIQQECFDSFKEGNSMVITGPAGCGKSYIISKIREYCRENNITIGITAMTGAAASLIGGMTLHTWSGIGLGQKSAVDIFTSITRTRRECIHRWNDTRVLIIDEISMMDASLFNKLNILAQLARSNNLSFFGGMQVILCGDFAQLKPIVKTGEMKFAFESDVWKMHLTEHTFCLKEVIRQSDPVFQGLLSRIRLGTYTAEDKKILNSRLVTDIDESTLVVEMSDGTEHDILATKLFPMKKDVSRINKVELTKLINDGAIHRDFFCVDTAVNKKSGSIVKPTASEEKSFNSTYVDEKLTLAIGAQVMLIKNLDFEKQLINGSRGTVIKFDKSGYPIVLFDHGVQVTIQPEKFEKEMDRVVLSRKQIPLILAWALTIHKCQGATLTNVITDLSQVFDEAQVYVTLSRARTLEGLFILGLDYRRIKCNPRVKEYYKSIQ